MPIYDNDGTASREIGKLYDHNGSANTQIGKVYDNNGSANSLIYTSEYNIVTASNEYTGGWIVCSGTYLSTGSVTNSGSSLTVSTWGGSSGWSYGSGDVRSGSTINLSGFNTLYFTISSITAGFYKARLGITTAAQNGSSLAGNTDYFWENGGVYKTQRHVAFTAAGSYSMNISDLSGGYYIFIGGVNGGFGSKSIVVTNLYLV